MPNFKTNSLQKKWYLENTVYYTKQPLSLYKENKEINFQIDDIYLW
jgi:hypothetical protein